MAEKEEKKVPVCGGVPVTTKIVLGVDKEGNKYGPKNNPKRKGSATHGRFEKYKDNMTVAKALEAGVTPGDIRWDLKQGFIKAAA